MENYAKIINLLLMRANVFIAIHRYAFVVKKIIFHPFWFD